ncbi:MAG: GNAT family N-acetyltransferase [Planctomycetota bacterium]|jgi:CelD/BcsL family acetyltransferase involved in cellulose biosynthesis
MSTIQVKHIHTLGELDGIKNIWEELERVNGGLPIFQSWIWNRTWCEHYICQGEKFHLDVRLVQDTGGRTLAIIPFFKTALAGPLIHLVQFLGHRMSYHNDILLVEPDNQKLAKHVVELLIEDLGYRTVIHLRHLDQGSQFTKQLLTRRLVEPQCSRVWIKKDPNITAQCMRLGRSKLKTLRWAENQLRKNFNSEYRVRVGTDILEAFDELVKLHQLRFASKGRYTRFQGRNLVFRKDVMSKFDYSNKFEVVQLRAAGRTIAATLMICDKQNYYCIQTGFDPEYSRYSPMRLLLTEVMRHGFEDLGCDSFDFGPGYERYKFDWKPTVGTNYFCCMGGPGLYAKSLAALYRFAFKRSLPPTPQGSLRAGCRNSPS